MKKITLTIVLILISFLVFSQTHHWKLISAISYDKIEGYAYPDKTMKVDHKGKSSIYYDSHYEIDQIEVGKTIWTFTPNSITVGGKTYKYHMYNGYFNVRVETTKRIFDIKVEGNYLYVEPSEQYAWVNDQDIHRKSILKFEFTTEGPAKPLIDKHKTKKFFKETAVGKGLKRAGDVIFLNLLGSL